VVQYQGSGQPEPYRVIVYPQRAGFRTPLTFASKEELAGRLSAVLPRFDATVLDGASGSSPQILFATTLELSDAELATLWGMRRL